MYPIEYSFIIPVYNCARYIEQCVASIVDIGLSSYEIILIDDGSTDSSGMICDRIVNSNTRVQCKHQSNSGVSSARNKGIEIAKGRYIVFVDGDDTLDPSKAKDLFQNMNSYENVDMVIFGMSFDYFRGDALYKSTVLCYKDEILQRDQWVQKIKELYESNSLSSSCNKIFKHDIIDKHSLRFRSDMIIYEDLEFVIKYLAFSRAIACTDSVIYHYRHSLNTENSDERLSRIKHLSTVLDQIEKPFLSISGEESNKKSIHSINEILIEIYTMFLYSKIRSCSIKEISSICDEFRTWWERHDFDSSFMRNPLVLLVWNKKIFAIIAKRVMMNVRHQLSTLIKNVRGLQRS